MATVKNNSIDGIDPNRSLGDLVVERPARARLFERLQLDYCCGGQESLAEACTRVGIQLETVRVALQTLDEVEAEASGDELVDWRTAETQRLCEHIVDAHHQQLRRTLPRIGELVDTVIRVHGSYDPSLENVGAVFGRIRTAFEPHLDTEEAELFPAILAAERGSQRVAEEILHEHEQEHAEVGAALVELRDLCHGYDRETAHCSTHRMLLDALEELEADTHRHVHEENNILFPRARAGWSAAEATVAG
jgi:regulator of cell morphogenesis and NO signaling